MRNHLYQILAQTLQAMRNCEQSGNSEWQVKHEQTILDLVNSYMPSGSGVDNGTKLDFDASKPNKLVFVFGYHHMNEGGFYAGWTEHTAIVTPDLAFGFNLKITGRDRNEIKEYLHDVFHSALSETVQESSVVAA